MRESYFCSTPPPLIINDNRYYHPVYKYIYCDDNGILYCDDDKISTRTDISLGRYTHNYYLKAYTKGMKIPINIGSYTRTIWECHTQEPQAFKTHFHLKNGNPFDKRIENITPYVEETDGWSRHYREKIVKKEIKEGIYRTKKSIPHHFETKNFEAIEYYLDLLMYPSSISRGIKKEIKKEFGRS